MNRSIHPRSDSVLAWENTHRYCFLCGGRCMYPSKPTQGNAGLVTHHIQRRGTSFRPYRDIAENLMRLCWLRCHEIVERWPAARQLALKWQHDRCGHDSLAAFLLAWLPVGDEGTRDGVLAAPERVTVAEIEAFLPVPDPRTAHLPPLPQ